MNRPPTTSALLALALFGPAAKAADDPKAQETFAALKQRLPGVVTEWAKKSGRWDPKREASVELVRRVAADDDIVTIYLRYYDGVWTTTRYDTSWTPTVYGNKAVRFLMLAIDKSGG
jgi:hypothetical protein